MAAIKEEELKVSNQETNYSEISTTSEGWQQGEVSGRRINFSLLFTIYIR